MVTYAAIVASLVVFWRTATVRALCAVNRKDDGRAVNRVIDVMEACDEARINGAHSKLGSKLGFDRLGRVG
jgi:hypothetical protein